MFDAPSTTAFGVLSAVPLGDAFRDAHWNALHPVEQQHAITLGEVRRATWVGGRAALRRSLDALGVRVGDAILSDDRGAPVLVPASFLPSGEATVFGSVAHKESVAVALALAGGRAALAGVGVDVEYDRPGRVDIARRILTAGELAAAAALSPDVRARAVRIVFALKEAVYKAIDPLCRRYVAFREVALDIDACLADGAGATDLKVSLSLAPEAPEPLDVAAAWLAGSTPAGEPILVAMASATRFSPRTP